MLDFRSLINDQTILILSHQDVNTSVFDNTDVTIVCDSDHFKTYQSLITIMKPDQLMIKISLPMIVYNVILLMRDQKRTDHVDNFIKPIFTDLKIRAAIDAMTPHAIDDFIRIHQTPILKPIKAGKIGCLFSHLSIWKDFLSSDTAAMLVMEDDIIPINNFMESFALILEELPPTFDLLYLHLDSAKNYEERSGSIYSTLLKRDVPREDTCAYLISRKGADKLIKLLRNIRDTLGTTLKKQIESGLLETYTVKNALFTNIGQKEINQDLSQGMLLSNTCNSQIYIP